MRKDRLVEPGQVWEFPGDEMTPNYGLCLVLREDLNRELDVERASGAPHLCFILLDEGAHWGEGEVVTLWLHNSNWELLGA